MIIMIRDGFIKKDSDDCTLTVWGRKGIKGIVKMLGCQMEGEPYKREIPWTAFGVEKRGMAKCTEVQLRDLKIIV